MGKETKEDRFTRVAEKRVQTVINCLRTLSQLNNTKVYAWNNDQLSQIWTAIEDEMKKCKMSFNDPQSELFKFRKK